MPAYSIKYHHSAMCPEYIGVAIKYAHTETEALDCLAKKGASYSKKLNQAVDSKSNVLTIISINQI
jgi:hypothetical protein